MHYINIINIFLYSGDQLKGENCIYLDGGCEELHQNLSLTSSIIQMLCCWEKKNSSMHRSEFREPSLPYLHSLCLQFQGSLDLARSESQNHQRAMDADFGVYPLSRDASQLI